MHYKYIYNNTICCLPTTHNAYCISIYILHHILGVCALYRSLHPRQLDSEFISCSRSRLTGNCKD